MLESLKKPGSLIVKTGTIIGGIYVARGYMRERLEDVREKMEEETRAKER
jgi:peroxin-3